MIGDGMAPMMTAPAASSAVATSPRVRRCTSGSRMTPRPADASTRPASNWGFTSTTSGDPGAATGPVRTGTARVAEMNDRSATTRSTGTPPSVSRVTLRMSRRSSVGHPGMAAQPRVELAVADVDGDHVGGAGLEQAVGEPPGRRAGVQAATTGRVEGEAVEGGVQLVAAAADEARAVTQQLDGLRRGHQARRLVGDATRRRARRRGR